MWLNRFFRFYLPLYLFPFVLIQLFIYFPFEFPFYLVIFKLFILFYLLFM